MAHVKLDKATADRLAGNAQVSIEFTIDPHCRWCGERLETLGAKRRHEKECDAATSD